MIFLQTLGLHVSPVISSILDCNGCETSDLSEHVTIFFDLKQSPSQTNVAKCVFAIDNPHMYESYTGSYHTGEGLVLTFGTIVVAVQYILRMVL